ncbi:MAG: polysaccharide export protein, partial [Nitrospira sp.]
MLIHVVLALLVTAGVAVAEMPGSHEAYRVGPNDVLRIIVFGEDDLTVERKVEGDGKIEYPLLGTIRVGGRTIEEIQALLTAQLAADYVQRPQVSVSIARHRNFYVGGEVKTPGGYAYEEGLSVQ